MRAPGLRGLPQLPLLFVVVALAAAAPGAGHNFHRDFDVVWGAGNARFRDGGREEEEEEGEDGDGEGLGGRSRCPTTVQVTAAAAGRTTRAPSWMAQRMDWWSWMTLTWVRMNYMVYDYCADRRRFPHGFPTECLTPMGTS